MPLNPDVTLNLLAIQEMDIQWRWMKVGKMFFNHTQHSSIDKAFRQHFLNTVWLIPSEILMHLKLLLMHATKRDIFQLSSPATICMLQFKLRLFCWLFKIGDVTISQPTAWLRHTWTGHWKRQVVSKKIRGFMTLSIVSTWIPTYTDNNNNNNNNNLFPFD